MLYEKKLAMSHVGFQGRRRILIVVLISSHALESRHVVVNLQFGCQRVQGRPAPTERFGTDHSEPEDQP